ncbi:EAL domain-containing protein [Aeromonas hydrophila]|uniref:EAL domain-containing protein n=1 Tax=Aeromonas hydrophila TaxID=644 RepID=A0A926FNF9_AERHY|nr:EAL domain-containing protein [Aeromonas hydrophila]
MTEWLMALVAEKISVADVTLPPGFTINFNVTLSHLLNPSLKTACEAFLKAFERGDKPRLCLELVGENHNCITRAGTDGAFRSLQASGVCFAVDDYGTGYSSLKHIHSSLSVPSR